MKETAAVKKGRGLFRSFRFRVNDWRGMFTMKSYSQEGEDIILGRYLSTYQKGFYVDVGAHHPIRFSNTYAFYKAGWSGINIDAMPGSMELFRQLRPRDISIEAAISGEAKTLVYHIFSEPALNTFDAKLAASRSKGPSRFVGQISLMTRPLREILSEYLPAGADINFMSVDVEGLDLDVLRSNDWKKFRPGFVLVESSYSKVLAVDEIQQSDIHLFMTKHGYELIAKSYFTTIYRERRQL